MTQYMDETIDGMTYCAIFFCTRKAMTPKKTLDIKNYSSPSINLTTVIWQYVFNRPRFDINYLYFISLFIL